MSCLDRLDQHFYLLFATSIVLSSGQTSNGDSYTNQGSSHVFYRRPEYPRDCNEISNDCFTSSSSGVYLIKPDGYSEPFEVLCNNTLDSGGWTVIQRRIDGYVYFNRSWKEFKEGFGFLSGEFWLGNEKLSYIVNQGTYTLHIDMVLSNGSSFYIEYGAFRITDEWGQYSLTPVGEYSGNASSVIASCPPDTLFVTSTCEPVQDSQIFTDCNDAYQTGCREDGVYVISPKGWTSEPFMVPCNMSIDGGGWTVLQRRVDGSVNFERNWEDYKNGFGILTNELWLGNDKIHYLAKQKAYELRMDLVNLEGSAYFAKYSRFRISNENSKYRLQLGAFDESSDVGFDAMNQHRNQFFSTPDRDNDQLSSNCANYHRDGWWYGHPDGSKDCSDCAFNRPELGECGYLYPWWKLLPGGKCLMYTDIKIRPV